MKTHCYALLARSTKTFTSFLFGLLLWLSPQLAMGQPACSSTLFGSHWTGSEEIFTSLDISAQVFTDLSILNGVQGLTQGESTFDSNNGRYFNLRIGTKLIAIKF